MKGVNELSVIHIEDLKSKLQVFKKLIEQGKLSKEKRIEIEEELCYIQRELDMRKNENVS